MSANKTEQPTAKKLRDARKKGQVFRSMDLTHACLFVAAALTLLLLGGYLVAELKKVMLASFTQDVLAGRLGLDDVLRRTGFAWSRCLLLSAPLLLPLVIVSAAVSLLQVKPLMAPEVVKPQLKRVNAVEGFKNIFFKSRTYIELIKNVVKFAVILFVCYQTIRGELDTIALAGRLHPDQLGGLAADLMFRILFKVGVVFLVIGAADVLIQRRLYMKEMMMTREEVLREFKEEEGDPHVKYRRKQIHQEVLAENLVGNVPQADVVVVNPTEIAVAVRYDERRMNAPRVTAKGQMRMAERILALAKEHKVPIMRNVPLAHGLFEVEVGQEIPEQLYEAVAEVLNWVYRLKQQSETS